VWTGSEMIVWGGSIGGLWNTGGRYDPSTDTWIATSTTNAPTARSEHTVVWTGTRMIVWGGYANSGYTNTGGMYDPSTDSWTATSAATAPSARGYHTAVWTGSEMIIWGGSADCCNNFFNNGGRYDPNTNIWIPTNFLNAPASRHQHTAVWTGAEMIVWGGNVNLPSFNTGGRYNPGADSWTPTSTTGAPDPRSNHTAIWTGTEMIVWGGSFYDLNTASTYFFNSGAKYCAQPNTPIVQRAASRKTQGSAGRFDTNLPLSGMPGIECRRGGATSDYMIVVTFLANVSVSGNPQAQVSSGTATIGSGGVSNGGMVTTSGNVVTIPLTNVANAQTITVTLNAVNGSTNVAISMSVLFGDVNADGAVNSADISQTKSQSGQTVSSTNFREDLTVDGNINSADISLVKSKSGTALP
jgi:hypothetical protein